jgi:hypothetical protein
MAAWLQQYIVLQRAMAMEEEAKRTWLRPGVTERYLRRLREWKQRKLTEWQQHFQKAWLLWVAGEPGRVLPLTLRVVGWVDLAGGH